MTQGQGPDTQAQKRQDIYAELRAQVRALQQKIDPALLAQARSLITAVPQSSTEDLTPGGAVKIDRQANIKWVSAFLSSPQGAHLREKLMGARPEA